MFNVGKYTSPIYPMGYINSLGSFFTPPKNVERDDSGGSVLVDRLLGFYMFYVHVEPPLGGSPHLASS